MAERLRLGPASSPKALGLVAAVVLLAALVLTGRWLEGAGGGGPPARSARTVTANTQAPDRIGGQVDCPPAWPVLAMSNHASYPAGHPTQPPPDATPVACYQTGAQAANAGYAPAPPPAGVLEVGGVYLIPPSRGFRASCQRAADRLDFVVPCPGLLPTSAPGRAPRALCDESSTCRRGQLLGFVHGGFVVPLGYVGAPGGSATLGIIAMPTRGTTGRLDLRCPNERRIAMPTVHRIRAVLAACPDQPLSIRGRRLLLRWAEQGTVVAVTTPGSGEDNQRLILTLAEHVRLVGPGR